VQTGCRSAGIGCIECKQPVIEGVLKEQEPMRERAKMYEKSRNWSRTSSRTAAKRRAAGAGDHARRARSDRARLLVIENAMPEPTLVAARRSRRTGRVYGEFMAEMPRDLYIPPDALEIILDSFEGPLDLLLY